jgi:hypothetical protein
MAAKKHFWVVPDSDGETFPPRPLDEGREAIPRDTLRLTEAYSIVRSAFADAPKHVIAPLMRRVNAEWEDVIEASRVLERQKHSPERFDQDIEQWWYEGIVANVILRTALERPLQGCIRDPQDGAVLRLTGGWLPSIFYSRGLPPDIWADEIDLDEYSQLGPSDAFVRGKAEPVFIYVDNFKSWFKQEFGSMPEVPWFTGPADPQSYVDVGSGSKANAVLQALQLAWPPYGPGKAISDSECFAKVNEGRSAKLRISIRTIRRVRKKLPVGNLGQT